MELEKYIKNNIEHFKYLFDSENSMFSHLLYELKINNIIYLYYRKNKHIIIFEKDILGKPSIIFDIIKIERLKKLEDILN